MALSLASVNAQGLISESRRAKHTRGLQYPGVDVCCIQEAQFSTRERKSNHSEMFVVYSACFDSPSVCVSWLVFECSSGG